MDTDVKLRPVYLLDILKERTDEDHYLTRQLWWQSRYSWISI